MTGGLIERQRGKVTRRLDEQIHAVVDGNGLPVRLP